MPELPEVEVGRKLAEAACRGKTIDYVYAAEDDIVFDGVSPKSFARTLKGRQVEQVHRRGKQLWMTLDAGPHPLFHFGMTGSFKAYSDEGERHAYCKCELLMHDGTRLGMKNSRRLGRIKLRDDPENQPPISRLGFDPYLEMPGVKTFTKQLTRRKAPVKAVLLDQGFAAGVGNWIADEVLYHARIDPRRRANELSEAEAKTLRTKLGYVIRKAVECDADYQRFPESWLFVHRWRKRDSKKGEITDHEGNPVTFDTVGGRTTSWVPARQG